MKGDHCHKERALYQLASFFCSGSGCVFVFSGYSLFIDAAILYPPQFVAEMGWPIEEVMRQVKRLTEAKILAPRRLRESRGAAVYECSAIFMAWEKIDKKLNNKHY